MKKFTVKDILAITLIGNAVLFEAMFRSPKKRWGRRYYDCCLVCGFPANDDGTVSPIMKSRTDKGIDLYKKGLVDRLFFTGGAVGNEFAEAEVMKNYAISQGVPEKDIITELSSRSTYENMKLSLPILREQQIESLIVVTNDWHLRKADHYTRKMKLEYVMVEALKPEGESALKNLGLHIYTNASMYYNLWKGLY